MEDRVHLHDLLKDLIKKDPKIKAQLRARPAVNYIARKLADEVFNALVERKLVSFYDFKLRPKMRQCRVRFVPKQNKKIVSDKTYYYTVTGRPLLWALRDVVNKEQE